jgi:hypothetical protein
MRYLKVVTLVLVLIPTLAFAQKKAKKPKLPAVIGQAHFVYVEAVDGEEFNSHLMPADRIAIADVRDALRAWGRYTFTTERDKADLVFVVRKGRRAGAGGGMGDGDDQTSQQNAQGPLSQQGPRQYPGQQYPGQQYPGQQYPGQQYPGQEQQTERGIDASGEAGPEPDLLQVCQIKANGKLSRPLWIHSFPNGLNPPQLLLFAQFREAVEQAYPKAPAAQPSKP